MSFPTPEQANDLIAAAGNFPGLAQLDAPWPEDGFLDTGEDTNSPGNFPISVSSGGLVNVLVVKAGGGSLFSLGGLSTLAGAQFIQFHDANALPANGAVPVLVVPIASAAQVPPLNLGQWGRAFLRGIVVCNSTTAATLTLGAANCFFDAQYW